MYKPHLTVGERGALEFIYRYQKRTHYVFCDFPFGDGHHRRFCGSLVRKGLLEPMEQGQNPIHEPPSKWTVWAITPAGKKACKNRK